MPMIASCGTRLVALDQREDRGADEREAETHPINARAVRIAAERRHQQGQRGAQRGNLRQRQVHEDDPALHDMGPRYTWMPAMIRLAAIAGNRNWMISQSIALLLPRFRKGRDEQIDVEVEELDVVLRAGLASNRRRHGQHRRARLRRQSAWASSSRSTAR